MRSPRKDKMTISYRVSIKDIAKAAGVSFSTVSRALNNSPLISQEVREQIQELAQSMGYTPNALAQGLQSQQTNSIGLVLTTIADPFFAEIVQGVDLAAKEAGISVLLAATNNDPDEEIKIIENFSRRRVDGVIVASSRIGVDYSSRLQQIRIPVIIVNTEAIGEFNNLHSISVDDQKGAKLAVHHLVELGHRKIGYLGITNRPASNAMRLKGYTRALREYNIPFDPDRVCMHIDEAPGDLLLDVQVGRELARQILATDTTAVFCYCDTLAAGVLDACKRLGVRVPGQLSVVGFDNNTICELLSPPLTTVHQPKQEIGRTAVRMLLDSLAGSQVEDQLLEPALVVRESTAAPQSSS